jgi:hypothetical protein
MARARNLQAKADKLREEIDTAGQTALKKLTVSDDAIYPMFVWHEAMTVGCGASEFSLYYCIACNPSTGTTTAPSIRSSNMNNTVVWLA